MSKNIIFSNRKERYTLERNSFSKIEIELYIGDGPRETLEKMRDWYVSRSNWVFYLTKLKKTR